MAIRSVCIVLYVMMVNLLGARHIHHTQRLGQAAFLRTDPEHLVLSGQSRSGKWFRENAKYNDFVLASEQTSQVLAQKTGLRVYVGHPMETLEYQTKQVNMQAFFQGELPELASQPIKWVVYGPYERRISCSFQSVGNLELVYDNQVLQISEVK